MEQIEANRLELKRLRAALEFHQHLQTDDALTKEIVWGATVPVTKLPSLPPEDSQ